MKIRVQQVILVFMLLVLAPCALLAGLLVIAAIASIWSSMAPLSDTIAIFFLLPAILLLVGDILLLRRLTTNGYDARSRHLLFGFYAIVLLYCGVWAGSTASRDGHSFLIFSEDQIMLIVLLLLFPILITLFTSPIRKKEERSLTRR
ncbi:hypothetical protein OPIT5_02520 [Opitutaceae bacterium TAV5]|nr:hypothetical protein OPIT5_02520 [Opitutaceae bacterium TAV5]